MNKISEETRRKMSEAKKGKNHPMYGKTRSEKTKDLIGESLKGYYKKYGHNRLNTSLSEEHKMKMSKSMREKYLLVNHHMRENPKYGSEHPTHKEAKLYIDRKFIREFDTVNNCIEFLQNYYGKSRGTIKAWLYEDRMPQKRKDNGESVKMITNRNVA